METARQDEEDDGGFLGLHQSLSDAAVAAPALLAAIVLEDDDDDNYWDIEEENNDDDEDDDLDDLADDDDDDNYDDDEDNEHVVKPTNSFETKEPALFALIRNTRVDAVQWYLDRFPMLSQLPGTPQRSALIVAVQACFDTAENWQDERDNQSMEDALNILCQIAAHSDLGGVVHRSLKHFGDDGNEGDDAVDHDKADDDVSMSSTSPTACTVFHWVASYGEGRTTQALVSAAVTECLITVLSDERVLWRTGTQYNELALHTAIRSRNYGVATSLLHRMEDSNASYDAFCRIHRPSKEEDNENEDDDDDDDDDDDETSVAVRVPLLQFALMHHTSSRFLVDLLELFPQAAKTAGQDRKLPLITALEHCYPVRKIDAIVEAYPAALRIATGDGDLPLHLAASYYEGADALAVLQHLLERNDAALTVANCHGQWPLHCAMENQGLPLTLELLQLLAGGPQPLSLSHVTTRMDKYQHVNEYTFPALQQADSYDELPLHICCRRLDSRLALEWLLEHSPRDAIRRGNRHGHLPLHLAAAASDIDDVTDATRMFNQIIQAYPEALYAPDSDGDLPLHCAVLLPHSLLDLLYVPDACNKMDGNWPLHIAARHGVDEQVLAALIRMHPHSVLGYNGDGQLPFHVAVEHELGVVRLLQPQERPPAVMDGTPALIAAAEASADISTLLHLALLSPDLFCQRRRLPRPRQQPVMAPQ